MNRLDFIKYMQYPEKLDEDSLSKLNELINEYPYFQTAHLLLMKSLHNQENIKFNKQLKISSCHLGSRKKLFYLLNCENSNKFSTNKLKDQSYEADEKLSLSDAINRQKKISEELRKEYLNNLDSEKEEANNSTDKEKPIVESNLIIEDKEDMENISSDDDKNSNNPQQENSSSEQEIKEKAESINPEIQNLSYENDSTENTTNNKDKTETGKKDNQALIDAFIENSPRIEVSKNHSSSQIDISKSSEIEDPDLITETLAKVYIKQKHFSKALKIYKKLILKYPQKSTYFAARMKDVENIVEKL